MMQRFRVLVVVALVMVNLGAAYAADPIQIQRNTATSDFGREVTFELEATSSQPATDVALLYTFGVAADDAAGYTEATTKWQQNGATVTANFTRDTSIEYLPIDVTLRYKWIISTAEGTITTPEQTIQYSDTRFNWREKTARGITVRWYEGDDGWGQTLLDAAVDGLDRLEKKIGGSVSNPMTISIYANTSDMRAALPPNSAEWIGGQARPDLGLIIGAISEGDTGEVGRLVPHELSHLVLHQATVNNYGGMPVWFDEGLAVVNQATPGGDFADEVNTAARNGELIPLRALASNFPSDPDKALLSYGQSASVIRFIESQYGTEALTKMVGLFKSGVTDDEAVQTALGISLDDLDQQWRATLPKAQRTPDPVAASDRAPSSRFRDKPLTRNPNGSIVVAPKTATAAGLPVWVWSVGGLGIALVLAGVVWNMRDGRRV